MFQTIDGHKVFVVEFDTMPNLPITGTGKERPYAAALDAAIRNGVVTEPGKYAIHITRHLFKTDWKIARIVE